MIFDLDIEDLSVRLAANPDYISGASANKIATMGREEYDLCVYLL